MSDDNIETEVVEEVEEIHDENEMETEIIVPDQQGHTIYEESGTEIHTEEGQNNEQTTITTVSGKQITTIDTSQLPQFSKDGKPVQFKILNINGNLSLVPCIVNEQNVKVEATENITTINKPAENGFMYPVTFLNQQNLQGQVQIKTGPIAPVTAPSSQSCDVEPSEYRLWSTNATRLLIELYKKYQGKVSTGEIKSWKKCWEIIADDINRLVPEVNISGCHAENRWRVLVRNYKKYLTKGSYKKFFEYAKEFDEINSMKERPYVGFKKEMKNENPLMLISQKTGAILSPAKLIPIKPCRMDLLNKTSQSIPIRNEPTIKRENVVRKKFSKVNVFANMRKDRLRYYKQRIAIEKVKLQLEREKISAMKLKNKLMKDRNEILANFNKNTVLYDICS